MNIFQFSVDFFKLICSQWVNCTRIGIITFGFLCYCPDVQSAFEKKEVGASSFALGNAAVAIDDYIFAVYYNPAALALSKHYQIAFTVQNFYGISGLNALDITTGFKLFDHPLSFAVNRFGDQKYQELQFSLGTRFEIIENGSIGFGCQCYMLSIQGYGQEMAWGINFGVLYHVIPPITIGALITNLNRPTLSEVEEQLPHTISMGFSFVPVNCMILSFEIFQDMRFQPEFRAGCSYQIIPSLTIRAGVEDHLNIYSYGLGIQTGWIAVDYAIRTHSVLGMSHIATLSIII